MKEKLFITWSLVASLAVVVFDLVVRSAVALYWKGLGVYWIGDQYIRIYHTENDGGVFAIISLDTQLRLLAVLTIFAILWGMVWFVGRIFTYVSAVGAAVVCVGGAANMLPMFIHGYSTDWIAFGDSFNLNPTAVINLSDLVVVIGLLVFAISLVHSAVTKADRLTDDYIHAMLKI